MVDFSQEIKRKLNQIVFPKWTYSLEVDASFYEIPNGFTPLLAKTDFLGFIGILENGDDPQFVLYDLECMEYEVIHSKLEMVLAYFYFEFISVELPSEEIKDYLRSSELNNDLIQEIESIESFDEFKRYFAEKQQS